MLDQSIKRRIIAEETSRFMDGNFGQLDLSGSPDLNHPPEEDKFDCRTGTALIAWTNLGSQESIS
jgi:hypothetical protein